MRFRNKGDTLKLVVPQEIASTNLRPDIVLCSRSRMNLFHRLEEAVVVGGPAGGALGVNRLLEEARKKSRMNLSGGCGPCEPFETRGPFQVSLPVWA